MNDPDASVPALPLENAPLIDSDIGWFVAGTAVVLGVGLIANGLLAECPEGKSCPADSRLLLGAGVAAAGTALGIVFLAGDAEPGQEEPPIVALRVSGPF